MLSDYSVHSVSSNGSKYWSHGSSSKVNALTALSAFAYYRKRRWPLLCLTFARVMGQLHRKRLTKKSLPSERFIFFFSSFNPKAAVLGDNTNSQFLEQVRADTHCEVQTVARVLCELHTKSVLYITLLKLVSLYGSLEYLTNR